ncbi:MAG: hypothetical protein ACK4F8_09825 [Aquabacterium sp.]
MTEKMGRFETWQGFEDRFVAAMAVLASEPLDVFMIDTDFHHWPLGSRAVVDAFHQWIMQAKSGHCTLLGRDFSRIKTDHPRWVQWRQPWAHRVHCKQIPADEGLNLLPTLVLRGNLGIRVQDPISGAGIWTRDVGQIGDWSLEIDVISQRSHEATLSTTLGL